MAKSNYIKNESDGPCAPVGGGEGSFLNNNVTNNNNKN